MSNKNYTISKYSIVYTLSIFIGLTSLIFIYYSSRNSDFLKNELAQKEYNINILNEKINELQEIYKKKYDEKSENICLVSYSFNIKRSKLVVKYNNKFNLKNGDRIELTYKNGNVKTTIELYVSIDPNIDKTDTSDFIISYGDLRILTNRRKNTKGIYEMTFKRTTTDSVTDNN